mmetsp:Transcript_18752/g.47444  ORF Transcript_18752/g.47444 Transcript_18752/m.47444 type:complete len:306 (-) Transcript_18752:1081-1998(-)
MSEFVWLGTIVAFSVLATALLVIAVLATALLVTALLVTAVRPCFRTWGVRGIHTVLPGNRLLFCFGGAIFLSFVFFSFFRVVSLFGLCGELGVFFVFVFVHAENSDVLFCVFQIGIRCAITLTKRDHVGMNDFCQPENDIKQFLFHPLVHHCKGSWAFFVRAECPDDAKGKREKKGADIVFGKKGMGTERSSHKVPNVRWNRPPFGLQKHIVHPLFVCFEKNLVGTTENDSSTKVFFHGLHGRQAVEEKCFRHLAFVFFPKNLLRKRTKGEQNRLSPNDGCAVFRCKQGLGGHHIAMPLGHRFDA